MSILKNLSSDLVNVDISLVSDKIDTLNSLDISKSIKYTEISQICQTKAAVHPEWLLLAGRVKISLLRETLPPSFSEATRKLKHSLRGDYYDYVMNNAEALDAMIIHENDFKFNIFAVETLLKSYLARIRKDGNTEIMESPQYLYLRVATFLWFGENKLSEIQDVYTHLTNGDYSHASPTLFNSGMIRHQLSSCFTLTVGDNMKMIAKSWHDIARISMNSGGIGVDFTSIRHSEIGQQGTSSGIVPWIKITDQILVTVDQGGKRKGAGTGYLADWHIDIEEFLELREATGPDEMRARNMTYALWISDEFMRRVRDDKEWTLFCPNKVKGMEKLWGADFESYYREHEIKLSGKSATRVVKARDLWNSIIMTQIRTGMPFMLYKDAINRKSNQQNLGTIRLSNLCTEITLFTDDDNIGSCNLGSIALNSCVSGKDYSDRFFDFEKLEKLTASMVRNVNQCIDRNYYPDDIPEIEATNLRNRPLGVGVMGLADVFAMLDLSWMDKKASDLNIMIFETMYYAAVKESMEMAKIYGPYETFKGSPMSKGLFQFDMWDDEYVQKIAENKLSENKSGEGIDIKKILSMKQGSFTDRYDWDKLRGDVIKYGIRNSLLLALMPTATSAQILGTNECFEPYTQHIYARSVLSGQFVVINPHLVKDLKAIGRWDTETVKNIWQNKGSIKNIDEGDHSERIKFLKKKYMTVFELPQKRLLHMHADRSRYICQTSSFNCCFESPTRNMLNAFHFEGWRKGVKTGMYYLRQTARSDPINYSLDSISIPKNRVECTEDVCVSCAL